MNTKKTIDEAAEKVVNEWKSIIYADERQADAALKSLIVWALRAQDRATRQLCAEAILEIDTFIILDNTKGGFIDAEKAFAACVNARTKVEDQYYGMPNFGELGEWAREAGFSFPPDKD